MGSIHRFAICLTSSATPRASTSPQGRTRLTMYMIIEGDIDIVVGQMIRLVDGGAPGSFIGEMAMIDASLRSASARAPNRRTRVPHLRGAVPGADHGTPVFVLDVMKGSSPLRRRRTGEE